MASRLRKKAAGWGARIRFGERLARDEWIALDVPHDQEPLARDRLGRLQAMARHLSDSGKHAEARTILEEAGATRAERGFRAIEIMAFEMGPALVSQKAPKTFRQVAQDLNDGLLHKLYPEEIGYRSDVNRERRRQQLSVFLPLLGDKTFDQITRADLDEAKRLVPQDVGTNTRRRYLRELRALMRFAVEPLQLVETVPHLSVPKEAKSDLFQLLYPDEELQLAGSEDVTFEERFLYAFMVRNGTRITEALQYTWGACDLERGVMHVAAEWTKQKKARFFDLDPDVLEALRLRRRQIPDAVLIFVPPPCLSKLHRCIVHQRFRPNLRRARLTRPEIFDPPAGERPLTPHDFRACCVSIARAFGMPDRAIMDRTGHESVEVFEKYDRGVRHAKKRGLGWWAPMAWALGMKGARVLPEGLGQARAKAPKTSVKGGVRTYRGGASQGQPSPFIPGNSGVEHPSLAPVDPLGPAGFSILGQPGQESEPPEVVPPEPPGLPVGGPATELQEATLRRLLAMATRVDDWDAVGELSAQLKAIEARRPPPNVTSLADARKRRDEDGGGK